MADFVLVAIVHAGAGRRALFFRTFAAQAATTRGAEPSVELVQARPAATLVTLRAAVAEGVVIEAVVAQPRADVAHEGRRPAAATVGAVIIVRAARLTAAALARVFVIDVGAGVRRRPAVAVLFASIHADSVSINDHARAVARTAVVGERRVEVTAREDANRSRPTARELGEASSARAGSLYGAAGRPELVRVEGNITGALSGVAHATVGASVVRRAARLTVRAIWEPRPAFANVSVAAVAIFLAPIDAQRRSVGRRDADRVTLATHV